METKIVELAEKKVIGLQVRTNNAAEMQQDEGKIMGLWQDFCTKELHLKAVNGAYGVYSGYESDHSGDFDVTAGYEPTEVDFENSTNADLTAVTLAAGRYEVFSAKGPLPKTLIELWQHVWAYYSQEERLSQRAFKTDFEYYVSDQEVSIYIGLK